MPVPPADSGPVPAQRNRRTSDERRTGDVRRAPVDRRVGEDRRSPDGRPTPASLLSALWDMPTVPEPEGLAPPMPPEDPMPPNGAAPAPAFTDAAPARPLPTWPCAVCETPNPLDRDTCQSCGAPFARLFEDPEAKPDVDPRRAMRMSLIFPGLGHAAAGRKAEGVARGALFLWCAGTAVLLLLTHGAGGLGILAPMAIVFVLGSMAWYGLTALDAYRLANGEHQIVSPKVMLYSVAGMMMLSVGTVFMMVTRASHLGH
jgi:hypothetical protein